MKLQDHIITFAGPDNLNIYKHFADYYNHYRALNSGESDKKYDYTTEIERDGKMVKISFAEKEAQMNEMLKKEILRHANLGAMTDFPLATYSTNPTLMWASFAVVGSLIDAVLPDSLIDTLGMIADVRVGGWGDNFSFDVESRDLFYVTKVGHGKRDSQIQSQGKGQVTMTPEPHQITVGVSLYKVLAGKESLASYVTKVIRTIESQMALDVYTSFAASMSALDNAGDDALRVAGYSQVDLMTLCSKVSSWNNSKAIVAGTPVALLNVVPNDANYRYDLTGSDYVKLGYVRTAFGYDLFPFRQFADWRTPFLQLIADDRLWIVSPGADKLVKLCIEGSTMSYTSGNMDNPNLIQTSTLTKNWVAGVCTSSIAACITL
jgi:hypothetical protein